MINKHLRNLMAIVGVTKHSFTRDELRGAWKRTLVRWHPDKLNGNVEYTKLVNSSYQKLKPLAIVARASNAKSIEEVRTAKDSMSGVRVEEIITVMKSIFESNNYLDKRVNKYV